METVKTSRTRLAYLDWLRGIAAVIMLQGHAFHAFTRTDLREGGPYILSQFVGGMPPAIFLFLTGVTLAFLMDSGERKGLSRATRVVTAARRSGYLFAIAYLFRFQLWLFGGPSATVNDLLKVDILNAMGLGILLMSIMAVFRTTQRVRYCAFVGLAIAAASPLVSGMDWTGVPTLVRMYFAPDHNFFSFFPWAAFLAFGMSAGSLLRVLKRDYLDRTMQWSALLGIGLILGAYYASNLPYSIYTQSDFWLNSPAQIFIKLGVILVGLPFAFVWTEYGASHGWSWSWVRQLGTTSLLVYWVHIELVYGRWLYPLKENLDVGETVLAAVVITAAMLLLAAAKTYRDRWAPALVAYLRPTPAPARVSGD
ncbi:MAG TPA: heparan-alpha-glucosaminide N-acetyltransferase domain-containing protein [Bryobacteraceae bacterium]|nr:heparan-alpha-glucosaminide N-acetyltransferase domain-containing protein [Bryobacteraceae bacterium]